MRNLIKSLQALNWLLQVLHVGRISIVQRCVIRHRSYEKLLMPDYASLGDANPAYKTLICILVFIFFSLNLSFASISLPKNANYPGGIAIVKLNNSKVAPKVFYQRYRVLVQKNNNNWFAIVGIPLSAKTKPGKLKVIPFSGRTYYRQFKIKNKKYILKHITIKDKSKVTPDKALARKIRRQQLDAKKLFGTWTAKNNVSTQFILPTHGWFSSYFGIRRLYNKVHYGRHTGLDIAAIKGTPIIAAGNGSVLAVKDFVLTGNTVFINHGEGLITVYCHMSKVDVKPGEQVTQGAKLGEVGATGRVTGDHLHWEVVLNGAKVNPLLFLNKKKA